MANGGVIKTGAWDPDEDDLLYYWQGKVGNKWSEVAKHIPGRTGQQCAQRWRHKVNPNIRRDKWTSEEDAKLIDLVKTFGVGRWAEIARHCDGRTDQQCMGRWRRHLDPGIKRDCWTAEEDAKLRQLHAQFGTSWSRISKNLKGRTSQQCRARWHQINNTRSRVGGGGPSSSGGAGGAGDSEGTPMAAAAAAAGGGGGSRAAGGRRASQPRQRRASSRRRHDSSCSEDEEEPEGICDDDDEECEEKEQQYGHDEQQLYAAAAAAAVAGYGGLHPAAAEAWAAVGYPAPAPAAAAASGGLHRSSSAAGSKSGGSRQRQHQHQQRRGGSSCSSGAEEAGQLEDEEDEEAEERPAAPPGRRGGGSRLRVASGSEVPGMRTYNSLPPHLGGGAAAERGAPAGSSLRHAGSMPTSGPSSSYASPSKPWPEQDHAQRRQQQQGPLWSPNQLLLSPPAPPRQRRSFAAAAASDMNEEEAAGAETLLEMASLFQQQEAYEQPGSMHQQHHNGSSSVPLPAYTPPKRPAGDRSDDELADGLSPSPYKRARSSRGALFHEPAAAADAQHSRAVGASRGPGRPPGLPAADAAVRHLDRGLTAAGSGEEDDGEAEEHEGGSGEEQQHPAAAAAARGVPRWRTSSTSGGSSLSRFRRPAATPAAVAQHAGSEDGEAAAGDGHGDEDDDGDDDAAAAATAEGFRSLQAAAGGGDMGALLDGLPLTTSNGGLPCFQGDPPARPSNASSYTGLRGHDAGAAAGGANFMSPPPRARGGRHQQRQGGSANTTPAKAGAGGQQPSMGLLGSPMFERMAMMAACATPPSAGHTQPSAATLAALQSPQPSRVHEPFWTPFTGLLQDALFTRGTSATPDLPSGGKPRLPRGLFSPAAQRSGSSSSGKVAPRRGLLGGSDTGSPGGGTADTDDERHGSQPSGIGGADNEPGPSPAAAVGLVPPLGGPHHRVVRRLDQHEAWGASRTSPSKKHERSSTKAQQGVVGSGSGFGLFSPVKKQRVPLFSEGAATIQVGVSPAKPDGAELLPIAPLKHDLPFANGLGSSQQAVDAAQQAAQHVHELVLPASCQQLHAVPPLAAAKSRDRAAAAAAAPCPEVAATSSELQQRLSALEAEQQQQDGDGDEEAAAAAGSGLDRAASIGAGRPLAFDELPNTPVHQAGSADVTSCSGTPATPADVRARVLAGAAGLAGSPSDYVTPPQHRLRPARPLAPLHKDCLIAAANRSLADGLATQQRASAAAAAGGGGGAVPMTTASSRAATRLSRAAAAAAGPACEQAGTAAAAAAAAAVSAAGTAEESPVPCSGDSSKLTPCEHGMDSPLEACGQMQSPSKWHQGMVAMLRSLQQTPLQPQACDGGDGAAAGEGDAAGTKHLPGNGAAGSRALRRLHDKLDAATAAGECGDDAAVAAAAAASREQWYRQSLDQQQQQAQSARGAERSGAAPKCEDAEMPFSMGLAMAAAAAAAPPPASPQGASTSAPMVLPLFRQADDACARQHAAMPQAPAAARPSSSGVASVSLTPAVMTLHTTPASATPAPGLVPPRLPGGSSGAPAAMAWPVQQRSDGGLVVSAPMAAAPGPLAQLTPQAGGRAAAGGASQPGGGGLSPLSVVSIQPLTLLASARNAALMAGQAAVLQSALAAQPARMCDGGSGGGLVATELRGPSIAAAARVQAAEPSHAVRSRQATLVDGV